MLDDFRPAPRRAKSLQATIDTLHGRQTPNKETPFLPPDEVASSEAAAQDDVVSTTSKGQSRAPRLQHHLRKLVLRWPPSRKEAIIAGLVILLVASGAGSWALTHHGPKPVAAAPKISKPVPKPVVPTTVPSTLSGLPVEPAINSRPITGVMIENSLDARPQSGLAQASVVFEAIAEGGITRFLALFQDTQPANVGPIRSARPYYVQWALGFDAGYAHVGGSPEALADIKSWGVKDLDQFYNGGSYHRVSTRQAPHNVYTSLDILSQLQAAKGYAASTFKGWVRKADKAAKTPTAKTIDLAMSGPSYNVHYDYDVSTNSYKRSEGGAPHLDAETSAQISPKVVIALVVPFGLAGDGYHSDYNTLGSGQAYVFQDGVVTIGNWNKADSATPFSFTDSAGQPLALNAGQTWLSAVKVASNVTYNP